MQSNRSAPQSAPATLSLALPVALAAQTFTAAAMFAPSVLAPAASADMGVPATAVGMMTSLIFLSAAFAAPQIGSRVPQLGALRVTQIGLCLVACGMVLAALAHPLLVLVAAMVIGVGYGPSTPSGSALLVERTPPRIFNFVMSIRQTGVPLGGALAGFALPWLILAIVFGACTLGWNGVYIAELAREAPKGTVAQATGASLAFAYCGAVVVPPLFALVQVSSGSYAPAFAMLAVLAAAGVVSLARRV